jgi:ComF family protein
MVSFREIKDSFLHLLFPHVCDGCGSDLLSKDSMLCLQCTEAIPQTDFEKHPGNPIEKRFYGRLPLEQATASYYFTKESLVQKLVHQVKYKGNKELGIQLGQFMGDLLKRSGRFQVDAMIPLPLFPVKEKKRGYNQSMLLCEGIKTVFPAPILNKVITRPEHTETQTKKGRIERWKNMEGKFLLTDPAAIAGKHILLVDDVITTGATLESCGSALLEAANVKLSIACLCYSAR